MQKKNLIIVFIVIVAAGLVFGPQLFGAQAMSVSEFSASLDQYLDKQVTITGIVGDVAVGENVVFLVDEGGCCNVPFAVPFTAEQQQSTSSQVLYSGTLPSVGDTVEATGTLKTDGQYFRFEIKNVSRNGSVIIKAN